jgi:hypothetical protein
LVNVGVIEAGASYLGNIDIDTPGKRTDCGKLHVYSADCCVEGPVGRSLASPAADFTLKSCPQVNCLQQEVLLPRGKALGGSSAVFNLPLPEELPILIYVT